MTASCKWRWPWLGMAVLEFSIVFTSCKTLLDIKSDICVCCTVLCNFLECIVLGLSDWWSFDLNHVVPKEWWIHSGQGFIRSFDASWSEGSRNNDPDPDYLRNALLELLVSCHSLSYSFEIAFNSVQYQYTYWTLVTISHKRPLYLRILEWHLGNFPWGGGYFLKRG